MPSQPSYLKQILFYLFFVAYAVLLAKALFFKEASLFEMFDANRTISRLYNFVPFKTILEYMHFNIWVALMNVVGNIVLFVPLGLYLQIFKSNKKVWISVALLCAASVCVEVIQYCLGIGSADIDDVILNTLGGLLGVCIYRILYLLLRDEGKTKTAVTVLFCFVGVVAVAGYFTMVFVLGFRIKIF